MDVAGRAPAQVGSEEAVTVTVHNPSLASAEDPWMTPTQVAEYVSMHEKTIRNHLLAGDLEGSQLRRKGAWRVKRSAVDRWLYGVSNSR